MKKNQETKLLNQIKKIIVDTTLQTLKEQVVVTEEIAFILFAYHFDMPFCPEVGLCKTSENEEFKNDYGPLAPYGVGDMAYFGTDGVYFYYSRVAGFEDIINQIHEHIDKQYGYEQKKQFIIDAYIDICKSLIKHKEIKSYIPTANHFHIAAYDSSELNVEVYLNALLPKDQLKTLRKEIQAEKDKPAYPEKDYKLFKIYAQFTREKINQYSDYKKNIDTNTTDTFYSTEQLYFIEPYRLDQNQGKLKQPIKDYKALMSKPITDTYYQYQIIKDKICYIAYHEGNKLQTETFYFYDLNNQTTQIKFRVHKSKRKLTSYAKIDTSNPLCHKYIYRQWQYNTNKLEKMIETDYHLNKDGLLTRSCVKELKWIHRYDARYDREFNYQFEHNNKGLIAKIKQEYFGDELVIFEADKSYIENNLQDVIDKASRYIMTELTLDHVKPISALILPNAVLTGIEFSCCYVLIKEHGDYVHYEITYKANNADLNDSCNEFNTYANAAIDNAVYRNDYLSKDEAELHMDRAYDLIAKKLTQNIKQEFKLDIPVFVGSYKLKTDAIIDIIEKEASK